MCSIRFKRRVEKRVNRTLNWLANGTSKLEDNMKKLIIKSSGNVFLDLGFAPEEAAILQMRSEVMGDLRKFIKNKKLTQTELQRISRDANDLINSLVEYLQRKELVSAQRGVVQVSYNGKKGEIVMTDSGDFFVSDGKIDKIEAKGFEKSDKKALEEALGKTREKLQFKLTSKIIGALKKELGDFEILL